MKYFTCAFALVWSYHVVRADEAPAPVPTAQEWADDQRPADLTLLHQKQEELRALQAEIHCLKRKTRHAASILFEIKIAEVSRAKWAQRQGDTSLLDRLTLDDHCRGATRGILSESGKKVLERLRGDAAAIKVVAEPSIMTIAGRPASLHVGGEVAVPDSAGNRKARVRYLRFGTLIDAVPVVLDEETLRLELRLQLSQLDFANSIEIDGHTYPGLMSRQADFASEIAIGKTLVVVLPPAVAHAEREDDGEATRANDAATETLVLVTPRWVEPMTPTPQTQEACLDVPVPHTTARQEANHAHGSSGRPPR